MANDGIIKGISDTEFAPDQSITRAEFTALIVRALDLDIVTYQGGFSDVKANDWFAGEVQAALDKGIISKDTYFRPNDTITREEMAKIIVEAYQILYPDADIDKADLSFGDNASISSWAIEYVRQAVDLGLMNGMDDNTFAPAAESTRAQSAAVIYRLLEKE